MRLGLAVAAILLAVATAQEVSTPGRLLRTLGEWTSAPGSSSAISPESRRSVFETLQREASTRPEPELVLALCRYQLANADPEFDLPARVLGRLYLDQSDAVLDVMAQLPGTDRIKLWPYLHFGWDKATEDKNRSLPRLVQLQKKLDRYSASLMNAANDPGVSAP